MRLETEKKLTFGAFLLIPLVCILVFMVYPIGKSIVPHIPLN